MSGKDLKKPQSSSGWKGIALQGYAAEAFKRTDLPLAQEICFRAANPETLENWLRGIEANQGPQLKAPAPPQHPLVRVALFEHPDTGAIMPVMLAGSPPMVFNGHALLAYTSPESANVAGFMMASWIMAWLSETEAREFIKTTRVGAVTGKPARPTRH